MTRESHADFLIRHRLSEPLLLLRDLCGKTQRREGQRRVHLAQDDILQLHSSFSVDALIQAIDTVLHGLDPSISTQASSCLFECPLCTKQYDSRSALRRHLTKDHDTRSGTLRTVAPKDAHQGLPTCVHCNLKFTTWASFRYHVQYVCASSEQAGDLADHEHRLRVTEFMHFSNAANFQALMDRPELLTYMSTHCILCGHYQLTSRGMLLHWTTEHADVFNTHGSALRQLQDQHVCSSPCTLCGTSYKRTHHCVILAQIALHQTQHRDVVCGPVETLHRCPHCPKAYVTKHGLRQHMDRYHRALTVTDSVSSNPEAVLYQCFLKAVESDDIRNLLNNPEILEFLGTRCAICRKSFKQRQYLTRHLRHHHAQLWLDAEPLAIAMQNAWRDHDQCWCKPSLTSKHVCLIFLQFCLQQKHDRPTATAAFERGLAGSQIPIGPGPLATTQQHINALLFFGELEQLYQRPDIRLMLTTHCQFCPRTFTDDHLLQAHLWERHTSIYQDSDVVNKYLLLTLFGRNGCLCNPGPGPHADAPAHTCVSIRQLAMLFVLSGQPLLIPYPYKAQEILDILTPLMDPTHTMEITFALQARRFGRLWRHRALKQMLRHNCLICQAPLDLDELQSHLLQVHQMDVGRFQMHQRQLTQVLLPSHGAGDCCDWCRVHLAMDADSGGSDTNLQKHLQECPVVLQLAVLLGHPAWDFAMTDEFAWPSEELRLASHRRRELRLRQFYEDDATMDAAQDIWKSLLTPEQLLGLGLIKPKEERQPNKRHKGPRSPPSSKPNPSTDLVRKMAQLLIRHEDAIQAQLSQQQFILHFGLGQGSIVPTLMELSKAWHQSTEKTVPLRHHLALSMMQVLLERLQKLELAQPTDALIRDCHKYHIVDSNQLMPYLQWSPKDKCLQPTQDKALSIQQVVKNVQNIIRLMSEPGTTVRFHSLKRPESATTSVPWLWMVSQQHAPELWHCLREMSWHASWQLIQVRIKPQTVQRSPLAQDVHRLLQGGN
eukprot:s2661_g15.t1